MRLPSLLLSLTLLAWAVPGMTQNPIHRCIGADGNPLFTDQPCSALQGTPVSPPAAASSTTAAQPLPVLCAANLDELRQSVINAFASRDANRMAGLMLWSGYGRGAVIADIRSLGSAMRQPLLDVSPAENPGSDNGDRGDPPPDSSSTAPFASNPPANSSPNNNQLVLHTAGMDDSGNPHELRFDIVRHAGCLWLRSAD
ncbi:DUF4124 domain-containing protein [Rhodanobacter sp. C01]|uniref:DUF4124 domain-containing protein n=1 Tax=Rhodanobacter sp. C01 TaxID=1945856 RepID=UPI000986609C|nr:DUF4124 domain-containing protein [Rhodanobacter sp. C01]OOG48090.1 DUF4124 domain-containing protein [Rhodanobacter sp. C01]